MSSAILYLAIVAIWALVLVPRWLRPHHTSSRHVDYFEPAGGTEHEDLAWADDDVAEDAGQEHPAGQHTGLAGHADGEHPSVSARGHDHVPGRSGAPERDRIPVPGNRPSPAERRARILRARRRTLVTFIVLTAGAVSMAVTHLAAWWVTIPPAIMLAGFVLLLREAARTDAGLARTASGRARPAASTGEQAGGGLRAGDAYQGVRPGTQDHVPAPEPAAEIIDISDRVGDQLYDQYTDAAARAVGD